ncbi:MAG: hypothetical protein LUG18_12510 [Candidatus Azobacteroides sp.]|nr:hypothetical protein [Candidatus Azobacteroides sp.]
MERVVILTQKGALSKGLQENTTVNVFNVEKDKIVGVEKVDLQKVNEDEFTWLMHLKKVTTIYVDSISKNLEKLLEELGIAIKYKDDIQNDTFIAQFAFIN